MAAYPSIATVAALPFVGVIGKGCRAAIWARRLLPTEAPAAAALSASVSIVSARAFSDQVDSPGR